MGTGVASAEIRRVEASEAILFGFAGKGVCEGKGEGEGEGEGEGVGDEVAETEVPARTAALREERVAVEEASTATEEVETGFFVAVGSGEVEAESDARPVGFRVGEGLCVSTESEGEAEERPAVPDDAEGFLDAEGSGDAEGSSDAEGAMDAEASGSTLAEGRSGEETSSLPSKRSESVSRRPEVHSTHVSNPSARALRTGAWAESTNKRMLVQASSVRSATVSATMRVSAHTVAKKSLASSWKA